MDLHSDLVVEYSLGRISLFLFVSSRLCTRVSLYLIFLLSLSLSLGGSLRLCVFPSFSSFLPSSLLSFISPFLYPSFFVSVLNSQPSFVLTMTSPPSPGHPRVYGPVFSPWLVEVYNDGTYSSTAPITYPGRRRHSRLSRSTGRSGLDLFDFDS